MSETQNIEKSELLALTADIVSSHVSKNILISLDGKLAESSDPRKHKLAEEEQR